GKLKQKLLNHLYFLDYEKEIYTQYERAEYECLHTLHQCKVLIREKNNGIAVRLLPHLIKTAKTYEFADIVVEALTILRNEYALMGKTTPFQETNDELQDYQKFLNVKQACNELYHHTVVYVNKSVSAQNRVLTEMPDAIGKIEAEGKKFKSSSLDVLAQKLRILYNQLNWNFADNVKLCTKLEEKYLQMPNPEVMVDLDKKEIAFTKLHSYYCMNDWKNGDKYATKALDLFRNGSPEWFHFIEYYFLLMMKGEKYENAGEIYRKVRTNKNYGLLEEKDKDRWQIYRAYLVFVNDTKLLRWGFDVEEFLKTTPDFSKELMGYNISTLVIQFMYLLREGYVDEVRSRAEQLEKYSSTHLDKRHNYRNSIFIRLLSIVTDKDFNFELVQEKGNTYWKKLVKTQIPGDLYNDLEVIPFETLWDYTLNILKTNKLYVHYRFYNMKMV
ncbi:hypothetical protein, partial [Xanthovirga aplysinae]|uniref:hypothetical protein n=1 Tax=Xanthovirga aplysinae TaxID=2529853 RepID=UPI00165708A3